MGSGIQFPFHRPHEKGDSLIDDIILVIGAEISYNYPIAILKCSMDGV